MSSKPRVRFAPSPTGSLHIGGVRTALFNWLFARHEGGRFLLRIEDTDRERSKPEYEARIFEALAWLGLNHDEEVVRQSERQERHVAVARRLLEEGKAYRCYCTPEELEQRREAQRARKETPRYDGRCRGRTDGDPSQPHVIRLCLPTTGTVCHDDLILGPHCVDNTQLDDFIILRADQTPTYNFVVAVDDHDMAITHVIRGADHISNTSKQLHVYDALGWERPHFAHVPNIHGPDGSKLSKRHGATDVLDYRDAGYLPAALLNYIVRLGWAFGDQELFTVEEMVAAFTLAGVNRSPAVFDPDKLLWCNGEHLRSSPTQTVLAAWLPHLRQAGLDPDGREPTWLARACDVQRQRCKTLVEMAEVSRFLFGDIAQYDEQDCAKWWKPVSRPALEETVAALRTLEPWTAEAIHGVLQDVVSRHDIGLKRLAQPIRVALCGSAVSPPIDVSLELLGRETSLARIQRALDAMRTTD